MLEDFTQQVAILEQLSHPGTNKNFIHMLDEKLEQRPDDPELLLAYANICRQTGNIVKTKETFRKLIKCEGFNEASQMTKNSVIPTGLKSRTGMDVAPLMVFESLLTEIELHSLLEHAITYKDQFRKAKISLTDEYDPDKRETLSFWQFSYCRELFETFAKRKLLYLCEGLGLPVFEILKIELKMTNHLDGGFFQIHCDNHVSSAEEGRAITWLLYFGKTPSMFTGGELYIFDSDRGSNTYSPHNFTKIKPIPNRLIAFPSHFRHAVAPTKLESNEFSNGRFAVSSHISKKADKCD